MKYKVEIIAVEDDPVDNRICDLKGCVMEGKACPVKFCSFTKLEQEIDELEKKLDSERNKSVLLWNTLLDSLTGHSCHLSI